MSPSAKQHSLARPRILCVDDEPNVLAGLSDTLRRHFEVVTAGSGAEGTEALAKRGPFTVVLSDFAMPGMNGAQFLAEARLLAPDTIRILLTGHASIEGAIAAVNEGNIFRFLTKPCSPQELLHALEDALEQARLLTADRELLERKLEAMSGHLLRAERLASLGTMAGAVGHELNNLLSVFISTVDNIRQEAANGIPPTVEDLQPLDQIRDRLATHARNLLRFGRPNQAREGEASTDLRRAVVDTVSLLRASGVLRHTEVDLHLPSGEIPIRVAGAEMEQVLVNVLKNAVDAVRNERRRPPRIEIVVDVSKEKGEVAFTIRDNGCGISKKNLPLIFEPYFTTKSAERGTGLGLFVVKQIIERAGGSVSVSSEEGARTTFAFKVATAISASPSQGS